MIILEFTTIANNRHAVAILTLIQMAQNVVINGKVECNGHVQFVRSQFNAFTCLEVNHNKPDGFCIWILSLEYIRNCLDMNRLGIGWQYRCQHYFPYRILIRKNLDATQIELSLKRGCPLYTSDDADE